MDLNTYLLIWICIFGLCFGSFYNVVILRSLSGESIVFPPSKCPKCNHKLYFWHNIPILSYIILRGKCYFCHEKISIQYPIVEFVTMVLFGFSFWKFGISFDTLFVILWLSLLLIMTSTDLKENLVDCSLAIVMGISGLVCSFISGGWQGLISSVLGLIAGVIIFETIARVGKLIAKTDVMGDADSYVAGALGAVFGIYNLPIVLLLGLFSYAIIFVPVFLYDKFRAKDYPTCVTFVLFFVSIILCSTVLNNYFGIALLLISAILFAHFMFRGTDTKQSRQLPYVPAFTLGTVLFLIFFTSQKLGVNINFYDNGILSDTIQKLLSF